MTIPHTTAVDWNDLHPRPGRLARSIQSFSADGCRVALLGLPDDTGVEMNGGRKGARHGPIAFRRALASYGSSFDAISGRDLSALGLYDAGDVNPAGDEIHHTHDRITDAVSAILERGMIPVCIGGGHDLTFAGVRALYRRLRDRKETLGGMNVDPHLDVRESVGSGMPFRRIIEDGEGVVTPAAFAEVGLGPFSNSREHLDWLRSTGAKLVFFDGDQHKLFDDFRRTLTDLERGATNLFASFDLDVLDASVAPAVSAINPMGINPVTASLMCRAIGAAKGLRYFDLMELSPPHDFEDRTARVAVHLFISFLSGLAERLLR